MKSLLASFCIIAMCAFSQAQTSHTSPAARHRAASSQSSATPAGPKLPPNIPPAPGKLQTAYALRYLDIHPGAGPLAEPNQFYTVHYTGWLATDGTKFDSSVDRGEPITFMQGARRVIPGWDTGFDGMHVGGKRRLFIPYQLAYGEQGRPPVIPPKSDLIFDIELVSVSATPPEPPAAVPAAPATPPAAPPPGSR